MAQEIFCDFLSMKNAARKAKKSATAGWAGRIFFAIVLASGAIAGGAWLHVRKGGFLWLSVYPRQRVDAFVAVHQIIAAGKIDLFPKCVACRVALENDQGGFMDAFPL